MVGSFFFVFSHENPGGLRRNAGDGKRRLHKAKAFGEFAYLGESPNGRGVCSHTPVGVENIAARQSLYRAAIAVRYSDAKTRQELLAFVDENAFVGFAFVDVSDVKSDGIQPFLEGNGGVKGFVFA